MNTFAPIDGGPYREAQEEKKPERPGATGDDQVRHDAIRNSEAESSFAECVEPFCGGRETDAVGNSWPAG